MQSLSRGLQPVLAACRDESIHLAIETAPLILVRRHHPNSWKNAPRISIGFPPFPGISPRVAPRIVVFELLKSWDAIPRMGFLIPRIVFELRELLREYPGSLPELQECRRTAHVNKRQKSSNSVKNTFDTFRHFSRRAKNVKNRQKVSKIFSTLFDIFRAAPVFRPLLGGSENGLFAPRAFFLELGWFPGFWLIALNMAY